MHKPVIETILTRHRRGSVSFVLTLACAFAPLASANQASVADTFFWQPLRTCVDLISGTAKRPVRLKTALSDQEVQEFAKYVVESGYEIKGKVSRALNIVQGHHYDEGQFEMKANDLDQLLQIVMYQSLAAWDYRRVIARDGGQSLFWPRRTCDCR